jgi:hypothetical protein
MPNDNDNAAKVSTTTANAAMTTTAQTPRQTPSHIIEWMRQLTDEQLAKEFEKEKRRRRRRKERDDHNKNSSNSSSLPLEQQAGDAAAATNGSTATTTKTTTTTTTTAVMIALHEAAAAGPSNPPPLPSPPPPPQQQQEQQQEQQQAPPAVRNSNNKKRSKASQPADLEKSNSSGKRQKKNGGGPGRIPNASWHAQYEKIKAFRLEFGHTFVPAAHPDKQFANWYFRERQHWCDRCKTGDTKFCTDEILTLLVAVGMGDANTGPYKPYEERWEDRYNELRAYKDKYGHFRVSSKHHRDLALWLERQRKSYLLRQKVAATGIAERGSILTDDRLHKLIAIGVSLKNPTPTFEERLQQMIRYKAEHQGCTKVPVSFRQMDNLGRWVTSIKTKYYDGKYPADRIAQLNAIGFCWDRRHVQSNWTSTKSTKTNTTNDVHDNHHDPHDPHHGGSDDDNNGINL